MSKETEDQTVEETSLSTRISLPVEEKNRLRLLCAKAGIAMRDYVERLVRSALATEPLPSGRAAMGTRLGDEHARFDEPRDCKYGCNYSTRSKSGLAQHEATCTFQRSARAQQNASSDQPDLQGSTEVQIA